MSMTRQFARIGWMKVFWCSHQCVPTKNLSHLAAAHRTAASSAPGSQVCMHALLVADKL